MDRHSERYYSAFWPAFAVIFLSGMAVPLMALFVIPWSPETVKPFATMLSALAVALLLLTLVAVYAFPVILLPEGVRSYNFWGAYRTMTWGEINSVGRFTFLGLRYVTLRRDGPGTIFVPLFLSRRTVFRDRVKDHLPRDHPFVVALS
jgi:hypothetical protein